VKILLTGANGLLGSAVASRANSVHAQCQPWPHQAIRDAGPAALQQHIAGHDWLLHCAANTNVEGCETDPQTCYRDNHLLTQALASAAAAAGVPMAFVSSTGVYGAHLARPYREHDPCEPTTHHHRSKLLAENCVAAEPRNLIVRTGWVFGGDHANPKNFVARRLADAQKGGTMLSNTQQRGCPTYSQDVADRILLLMQAGHAGLFNAVNTGNASRYEYVQAIVEIAGAHATVAPADAAHFQRKAPVSDNEMAENWRAEQIGLPAMPDWRASLTSYINGIREL
jgi:dTDP-4-dehydrorhamnose reductase